MPVSLTINGRKVIVPDGSTILEAARSVGIEIPTLCHHPDLTNVGACRLCLVSVDKARCPQTACTTPVFEGMVVDTESDEARLTRKFVLEMLLSDHPNDCMTCEAAGNCELQNLAYDYDIEWAEHQGAVHQYEVDPDPNPFVYIDRNKCILCGRCVRACHEIQNRDVWNFAHRGFSSKLVAGYDQDMLDARCESCGTCVAYCPVGALTDKMGHGLGRPNQVKKVRTVCSYCGVGCSFDLNVRDGKVIRVTSSQDAPVNGLSLCVKGRYGYDYIDHPDRLKRPVVRARWLNEVEDKLAKGEWQVFDHGKAEPKTRDKAGNSRKIGGLSPDTFIQTDWDTALDVVARKLAQEKKKRGPEAFAMLTSAKCTNEENFLASKLARQLMETNSIDHCARL